LEGKIGPPPFDLLSPSGLGGDFITSRFTPSYFGRLPHHKAEASRFSLFIFPEKRPLPFISPNPIRNALSCDRELTVTVINSSHDSGRVAFFEPNNSAFL